MNALRVRNAARQIGLWCLLVFVVTLLTLLFSILGTLTTSAATGLIMATARRWKWQVIPVSLVFPLVGLTLAQAAKADLEVRQRISMAALCFGSFWVIYLVGLLLLAMENNNRTALAPSAADSPRPQTIEEPTEEAAARLLSEPSTAAAKPVAALGRHDFHGTWVCETSGLDGKSCKRRLEIADGRFALKLVNSSGCACLVAEGDLKVEGEAAATRLLMSAIPTTRTALAFDGSSSALPPRFLPCPMENPGRA